MELPWGSLALIDLIDSPGRFVTVLPGRVNKKHPVGETSPQNKTFLSEFVPKGG